MNIIFRLFSSLNGHYFSYLVRMIRIIKYLYLSTNAPVLKGWEIHQPLLFSGRGKISGNGVSIGFLSSPNFYSSYAYIEAREVSSEIIFGANIRINNGATVISEKGTIEIGNDFLAGINLTILNSNFHNLDPNLRFKDSGESGDVYIGNNVFCGNNVTILKGVRIGDNSVIANGSVVISDVESNSIYGGNPAAFIKHITVEV